MTSPGPAVSGNKIPALDLDDKLDLNEEEKAFGSGRGSASLTELVTGF